MRQPAENSLTFGPRPPGATLQHWLYSSISDAIRSGKLPSGSRLPTSRSLARDYGVSRSTVTTVFERLLADGYICARVGRGSFVSDDAAVSVATARGSEQGRPNSPLRLSVRGLQMVREGERVVLRYGALPRTFDADLGDASLFPAGTWMRLSARRSRWYEGRLAQLPEWQGMLELRATLAEYLALSRGIRCSAEQIAIVSGPRQVADILLRLLVNAGEPVWAEDPGPSWLRAMLAGADAAVACIPVDREGLCVAAGLERAPAARLAFVASASQVPLGSAMSSRRRSDLLNWCQAEGSYVLDFDLDGDIQFDRSAAPTLKAGDKDDRVIHVGSFASSISPCKRLAYAVLPEELVEPFCRALALCQGQPSLLEQAVLNDFIVDGHWSRHVRNLRSVYGERADALRHQLGVHFGSWLKLADVQRGLSLTALLPDNVTDADVAARALSAGVSVTPLSDFSVRNAAPTGLRLGFAAFSEIGIREGARRLANALT